ncbi:MAG: hypothetical protein J1F69_01050 [Clostridiales bacterium]|nr:hypothetical protein [Clostridiales bacterium]
MKCTNCGLRDATTEVVVRRNNHVEKMFLCSECANNFRPDIGSESFDMLNKLINGSPMGLLNSFGNLFNSPTSRTLVCPDCKTTGDEFLKTGFVGCPKCYKVFEPLVVQTVKKLQQSDRHVGKTPPEYLDRTDEITLKTELQAAVDSGDYGKIVELSERLKKLLNNKSEGNQ